MIKLIATDMDGTLLDDKKNLPQDFDDTIKKLFDKKIRFAISSGRSFCTLREQFASYKNDLTFICDNGAYVVDKGEVISCSVLPQDAVRNIIRFCTQNGLLILLCGRNGTWHNSKSSEQNQEISQYYVNQVHMEDLTKCEDDIFKIAIFEEGGIENSAYPRLYSRYGDCFNVQLSGKYWTDIMNKGVTKGTALHTLQNRYGINYNDTMAFGDYLNDVEMLENSYYSFAMENSHDKVKKTANFTTGSNNDNSVIREIVKYCL